MDLNNVLQNPQIRRTKEVKVGKNQFVITFTIDRAFDFELPTDSKGKVKKFDSKKAIIYIDVKDGGTNTSFSTYIDKALVTSGSWPELAFDEKYPDRLHLKINASFALNNLPAKIKAAIKSGSVDISLYSLYSKDSYWYPKGDTDLAPASEWVIVGA